MKTIYSFFILTLSLLLLLILLPAPGCLAQTIIKKNNPQSRVVYFLEVDAASTSSAGKTGLTGAAAGTAVNVVAGVAGSFTSLSYSTNGSVLTNCAGTISEIGKGYYAYVPTSGEANTTFDCLFVAQATGALDYAGQVAFSTYKVDDLGPQTDKIGTSAGDSTNVTGIKAQTDKLLFDGSNNVRSILYGYNTGQDPATLVLDSTASSHNTAGSTGAKINAAGAAVNPLTGLYTTNYGTGSVGEFIKLLLPAATPVVLPTTAPAGYGFTGLSGGDVTAIVTGILGATIDGGLTFKQISALSEAFMNGRFSISDATSAPYVRTVTYYRVDGTTTLAIQPTTYTDSTFSKVAPSGRAKPTFSNLP